MTKKLEHMIERFEKKLEEARDLRREIENYIEDKYEIDVYEYAEYLEDECTWCYGFDVSHIEKLIEKN